MGRMVIVILAVGLCVALCQEKKGPDKLAEKQVTDGQQKKQRVGDKKDNGKDSGENGDKQDGHDQVNQTNGGDDKDDTHGDIKNQDAADHHGDAVDLHGDTADGDGAGNHGDGEGNHGDGEVHKKTTEKAIVSDKDLINDPAFNVTKIFPTQAPQPVNKKGKNETEPIIHSDKVVVVEEENEEGDDTKKKDKNTAEGDDDDENGDNKTGDVLVDFDVAPKPVKGNETET